MALRGDASGDYVERTSSLPSEDAVTIMGWFLPVVDRNDFSTFIRLAENAGGGNVVVQTGADGVTLNIFNGATTDAGSTLTIGQWRHIAYVGDPTNSTAYLDAVLDCQVATPAITPTRIQIGNASEFGEFLDGRWAAIKIFNVAKTADEIAQEAGQYLPVDTANLNAWYPMIDNTVADADNDYSGAGLDFTTNGTLAIEDGPPIPWRQSTRQLILSPEDEVLKGTAILDFGAFPGKSDASVVITGQAAIVSGSLVEAWIRPADTSDHTADEHMVDPPWVWAGNIVAGTGFTIYGIARDGIPVPDAINKSPVERGAVQTGIQEHGRVAPRPYGQWQVAWAWA